MCGSGRWKLSTTVGTHRAPTPFPGVAERNSRAYRPTRTGSPNATGHNGGVPPSVQGWGWSALLGEASGPATVVPPSASATADSGGCRPLRPTTRGGAERPRSRPRSRHIRRSKPQEPSRGEGSRGLGFHRGLHPVVGRAGVQGAAPIARRTASVGTRRGAPIRRSVALTSPSASAPPARLADLSPRHRRAKVLRRSPPVQG